jgi:hypothetical protein
MPLIHSPHRDSPTPIVSEDVFVLRDRLQALFALHGRVRRLDLVRADQAGQRRFLCFVRMATAQEDDAVAQALGLGRFGGDLVMLIAPDEPSVINPPWLNALPGTRTGGSSSARPS